MSKTSVQQHYDSHLGIFYSWMIGDFEKKQKAFSAFLKKQNIHPEMSKVAIDLGAGHGIQTATLIEEGYDVTAIDFCKSLLYELKKNVSQDNLSVIEGDILDTTLYKNKEPELIVCWGDTITHLNSVDEIRQLLENCHRILLPKGKLLLSFRNYTEAQPGDQFIIPVKSDARRILTCILNYEKEKVKVTDLLHEYENGTWQQKVSSYDKVKTGPEEISALLSDLNYKILSQECSNGNCILLAQKA